MLPDNHITSWDDFAAPKEAGDEAAGQPKPSGRNSSRKRPKAAVEAKEPSLAALLTEAIHLAGARRRRLSQAERIREQTLLEVLTDAMRRTK